MTAQAIERAAVSNLAQVTGFNDRIIQLVKQTVCPGANALELATFLYNAKRLGLDPMTRQIYFIKYTRDQPGEIVVGINGYRAQAEDSGCYAGSDDAEYEYEEVGQPKGAPSKATVTVWKLVAGQRVPFTASARWKEFYPGDGKAGEQYRKRPHNQLAIRAESHALRKGFPQQTDRLEIQAAPKVWEQAAVADEVARDDPEKIARDSRRYGEIYGDESDGPSSARVLTTPEPSGAPEPAPPASPPSAFVAHKNEQGETIHMPRDVAIVEQAHRAAQQRDADLAEIDRQRREEGLL